MNRSHSLRAVFTIRRQREELAERTLVLSLQEISSVKAELRRLQAILVEINESRSLEIQRVSSAADYEFKGAQYRSIQAQAAAIGATLEKLQKQRAEHMNIYMAARRAREVIAELQARAEAERTAVASLREQKWNEDLFIARKASDSYKLKAET